MSNDVLLLLDGCLIWSHELQHRLWMKKKMILVLQTEAFGFIIDETLVSRLE